MEQSRTTPTILTISEALLRWDFALTPAFCLDGVRINEAFVIAHCQNPLYDSVVQSARESVLFWREQYLKLAE
jgi:hypothetical protein